MDYLFHRGVKLPLIGFGTWTLGDNLKFEQREIDTFLYGINNYEMTLIDTAEMYGDGKSESVVGKIVKKCNRNKLFIVDKILPQNAIEGKYIESCKRSLEFVGVEYFDLYLLHWKDNVNLQDMVYQMENLVELGLIKRWGVSNFDVSEMEELFNCDKGNKCFCNQVLYNIGARGPEYDLIPWCKNHDVLFMAYSPLCNNSFDRNKYVNDQIMIDISKKERRTVESLMLSFVIRNKDLITVFKTGNVEHLIKDMNNVFEPIDNESLMVIDRYYKKPNKKEILKKI